MLLSINLLPSLHFPLSFCMIDWLTDSELWQYCILLSDWTIDSLFSGSESLPGCPAAYYLHFKLKAVIQYNQTNSLSQFKPQNGGLRLILQDNETECFVANLQSSSCWQIHMWWGWAREWREAPLSCQRWCCLNELMPCRRSRPGPTTHTHTHTRTHTHTHTHTTSALFNTCSLVHTFIDSSQKLVDIRGLKNCELTLLTLILNLDSIIMSSEWVTHSPHVTHSEDNFLTWAGKYNVASLIVNNCITKYYWLHQFWLKC